MQQLRQHMFGRSHCAPCAVAKSVFAFFAGFLTLAITFATSLILFSTLSVTPAFAEVGTQNNQSAEVAGSTSDTAQASKETAGQANSNSASKPANAAESTSSALSQNSSSTSKNSEIAAPANGNAAGGAQAGASTTSNVSNNGSTVSGWQLATTVFLLSWLRV